MKWEDNFRILLKYAKIHNNDTCNITEVIFTEVIFEDKKVSQWVSYLI